MYYTYIRLAEGVDDEEFQEKMTAHIISMLEDEIDDSEINITTILQPVSSIHLFSKLLGELKPNGDILYIYVLSLIALAILFIAGINFMNLATARNANRAREVSIRKILGSSRRKLIYQFIGESVFLSTLAFLFSLVLIEALLPLFNNLTNKSIESNYYLNVSLVLFFLGITLFIGIFSGSYPALYLSAFNPVKVLQSKLRSGASNKSLRNVLVFIQFAISSGLIACTFIIYSQLNYIQNKKLGFNKDNAIAIFLRNNDVRDNAQSLKEEFNRLTVVESASLASSIPGMSLSGSSYLPEGFDDPWLLYEFDVDHDFVEKTFQMEIMQGRNFSPEFPSDSSAVIINETLMKSLSWDDPISKTIRSDNDEGTDYHVIGVVKDFHFRSLRERIEPTLIHFNESPPALMILRITGLDVSNEVDQIKSRWEELNPELPFDFEFIDESFDSLYNSERRLSILFTYLSIFAIFIASLGLLGLISYTTEQRTKEIGIRKVLGASMMSLSKMLSIDYLKLILLAAIIAWPISFYLMRLWLNNFNYRIDIPVWPFLLAGFLIVFISLLVINLQVLRTARRNPVDSLRYE